MERRIRTRLVSLAILTVVLASGFVLGVAWERRGPSAGAEASQEARSPDDRRERKEADGDREKRERRLIVERLDLRPDQQVRVDSIVDVHRERMRALHREFRREYNPRYWSVVQETRDAMRSVLEQDQRIRYDSLLAEHDRRRQEDRREGRGRDDGGEDETSEAPDDTTGRNGPSEGSPQQRR